MKLGLFSDPHYCRSEVLCRTRRPSLSLRKIEEAMEEFGRANVDMCICLGDIVDKGQTPEEPEECIAEAMDVIRFSGIPYFILPGNHDYTVFSIEEFSRRTGCEEPPCVIETDTHMLIFLDANYRSDLCHYSVAEFDWKDSNLNSEQLDFLKNTLAASSKPCLVFIHENLDDGVQTDHVVKNAADVREIIEISGKVPLVVQGHYHKGADRVINGIRYLTLPAMCEGEDNHYMIIDV